jgi:LmbE family N-acetylglucosaminyl deacetylase
MRDFHVDLPESAPTVLALGAHCDDLEIGCGGTILSLLATRPDVQVHWVVLTSDAIRAAEARTAADALLAEAASATVKIEAFRDGFLPYTGAETKEFFEALRREVDPDLILTPYALDAHQDHRLVSELTRQTFRDHVILEYEIPKYDGDLGRPNAYVELSDPTCREKIRVITECYQSQHERRWFDEETFRALLRLRGLECNATSGFAEAFYARKIVVGLGRHE